MKIAISVPDSLFVAADALAGQLKMSRSQLYSDALAAYLNGRGADAVTEKLNAVCERVDTSPDPVLFKLQLQTMDPDETW
jgi:hypothetical protein